MDFQSFQVNEMLPVTENGIDNSNVYENKKVPTAAKIQGWLVSYIAELLEIEPDKVDVTIPFDCYGLDSSAAIGLIGDLEDWLNSELDPTLMYDYPTIEALVQHIHKTF